MISSQASPGPAPTLKAEAGTRGKPRGRTVARAQLGLEVVDLDSLIPEDHPARTL